MGGQQCKPWCRGEISQAWESDWPLRKIPLFVEIGFSSAFVDSLETHGSQERFKEYARILVEHNATQVSPTRATSHYLREGLDSAPLPECIYALKRGSVAIYREGKEMGRIVGGQVFGPTSAYTPGVVALTYCTVHRISHEAILYALNEFPDQQHLVPVLAEKMGGRWRELMNRHLIAESVAVKEVGFGGAFLDFLAEGCEQREIQHGRSVSSNARSPLKEKALYAIVEGSVSIMSDNKEIGGFSSGEVFGLVIGEEGPTNSLTYIAQNQTTLLCITQVVLDEASEKFREENNLMRLQEALDRQLSSRERVWAVVRRLRASRLIHEACFRSSFLSVLAESAKTRHYAERQVIVEEGGAYRCLFLLERGTVAVYQRGRDLGNMQQGSIFGETAVFDLTARQAETIVAVQSCTVLSVPQIAFVQGLDRYPGEADCLARLKEAAESQLRKDGGTRGVDHPWTQVPAAPLPGTRGVNSRQPVSAISHSHSHGANSSEYATRLPSGHGESGNHASYRSGRTHVSVEQMDRGQGRPTSSRAEPFRNSPAGSLRDAQLIQSVGLSSKFLTCLDRSGVESTVRAGTQIIREGGPDSEQCLCWLKSGTARVTRSNEDVCQIVAGDLFGEASLLDDNGRHSVRVVANTTCVIISYSRSALSNAIHEHPEEIEGLEALKERLDQKFSRPTDPRSPSVAARRHEVPSRGFGRGAPQMDSFDSDGSQ